MGWFLAITGLAVGIASLFSSMSANDANIQMQQDINEQNEKLFREANEFNRQERLETQDFNRQQVLDERAYNNPLMQSQRLLNAGLNPGAILGGDAAKTLGSATSSPGSSSGLPNLQAPISQPFDFSGMTKPFIDLAQLDQVTTETQIRKEDLQFKGIDQMLNLSERIAKIDNVLTDTKIKDEQRLNLQQERNNLTAIYKGLQLQYSRDFAASQYDDENNKAIRDLNVSKALQAKQDQEHSAFMQKLEEQYAPVMKKTELKALKKFINKMDAEIAELSSRSDLNKEQKLKFIEEKLETQARKNGIVFDNKLKEDTRNYLVMQIELDAQIASAQKHGIDIDSKQKIKDYNNPVKQYSPFIAPATGGFSGAVGRFVFK